MAGLAELAQFFLSHTFDKDREEHGRADFVLSQVRRKNEDAPILGHPAAPAARLKRCPDTMPEPCCVPSHPVARKKATGWGTEISFPP